MLTPFELGELDGMEDEPFCPEAYYCTQWQQDQYAIGYHRMQPEHIRSAAWVNDLWEQHFDEIETERDVMRSGTPGGL